MSLSTFSGRSASLKLDKIQFEGGCFEQQWCKIIDGLRHICKRLRTELDSYGFYDRIRSYAVTSSYHVLSNAVIDSSVDISIYMYTHNVFQFVEQ